MILASVNIGLSDWAVDIRSWPVRARRLARLVAEHQVDAVFLQEVFSIRWQEAAERTRAYLGSAAALDGDFDKAEILSRELPRGYRLATELIPSVDRGRPEPGLDWGLAVATRLEIESSARQELSTTAFDRWPRIVQGVRVARGGARFELFNLHLPAESRRSRLRTALEALRWSRRGVEGPRFLGGDLNDGPEEGPLHIFRTGFEDAWLLATERRVFHGRREVGRHEAIHRLVDGGRIDYLLAETATPSHQCRYYFDDLEPVSLSDHPMVIAEF